MTNQKTLSPSQAIEQGYTHFVECWSTRKGHNDQSGIIPITDMHEFLMDNILTKTTTHAIIYIKPKKK